MTRPLIPAPKTLYRSRLSAGVNMMLVSIVVSPATTKAMTDASSVLLHKSMDILGPVGGFIFLTVVAIIVLYKYVFGPEIRAARQSRDEQMKQTVAVAKGFEATSGNLKDTLATAERMQTQVFHVLHLDSRASADSRPDKQGD